MLEHLEERCNNAISLLRELGADLGSIMLDIQILKSEAAKNGSSREEQPAPVRRQAPKGALKSLILECLRQKGGSARAADVIKYVSTRYEGTPKDLAMSVRSALQHMYRKGQLRRPETGVYALPLPAATGIRT